MSNNYKIICSRFNEDIHWILPFIKNTIIFNKGNDDLHYIPQNNIIKCANEGREGGTYLKFIIDNYDDLPEYMLFVQGKPFDHIYVNDKKRGMKEIGDIINVTHVKFKYLSKHKIYVKKEEYTDYTSGIPSLYNEEFQLKMEIKDLISLIKSFDTPTPDIIQLQEKLVFLSGSQQHIYIYEFVELTKHIEYFLQNNIGREQRAFILTHFKDIVLDKIIEHEYYFGYGALFWVHKSKILKHSKSFWVRLITGFNELKPSAGWGLEKTWHLILNDYYERVKWIFNYPVLSHPPFIELFKKCYIDNLSKKTILFISNEVNNKYFFYKKNHHVKLFAQKCSIKKTKDIFVGRFKASLTKYFYNKNNQTKDKNKDELSIIYLNTLHYIEFKNSFECIIKNIDISCYFIIDKCINTKGFYLDNNILSYLYSYQKENNHLHIIGIYETSILCKFSK